MALYPGCLWIWPAFWPVYSFFLPPFFDFFFLNLWTDERNQKSACNSGRASTAHSRPDIKADPWWLAFQSNVLQLYYKWDTENGWISLFRAKRLSISLSALEIENYTNLKIPAVFLLGVFLILDENEITHHLLMNYTHWYFPSLENRKQVLNRCV